jgi:integrase
MNTIVGNAKSPKITPAGSTLVTQFHFTLARIRALPSPPKGQRAYYRDAQVRGLLVDVTPAGTKTFYSYRKWKGRARRWSIGRCEDLSIEQARNAAEKNNTLLALGIDPAEEKRKLRGEQSLQQLFDCYLELHSKPHKKTWARDSSMFNLYFGKWKSRTISAIQKTDVIALRNRIGQDRGTYSANRAIELLCSIYNWARAETGWSGENPASGIEPFPERKRERFMNEVELRAFFKSLEAEPDDTIRDFFYVCLCTGARRANVQAMAWSEINLESDSWSIPYEKSKNAECMTIALSPAVVRILKRRQASAKPECEWVFPGVGATGHLVEPKKAWRRICTRAKLKDLRIHDIRRTHGSWQAITGASLPIIGKSLGHKSAAATQVYARLDLNPVRVSVNRAVDAMLLAGGVAGLLDGGQ